MTGARLICRTGALAGLTREIGKEARIGGGKDNDVVVSADGVSPAHARVFLDGRAYWVEDLGSERGTQLDGASLKGRRRLDRLHVITLGGQVDLLFVPLGASTEAGKVPKSSTRGVRAPEPERPEVPSGTVIDVEPFGATPPGPGESPGTVLDLGDFAPLPIDEPAGTMLDAGDLTPLPERALEPSNTVLDLGALEPLVEPIAESPPQSIAARYVLVFDTPDGAHRTLPLPDGRYIMGRSPDCDISVPDARKEISRRHAVLSVDAQGAIIEDLGSGNGVLVKGEKVEAARLLPGASFKLGPTVTFTLRES